MITNWDHSDPSDSERTLEPIQLFSEYGALDKTSLLCQAIFLDAETDAYTHHEAENNSLTPQLCRENHAEDRHISSCPLYAPVPVPEDIDKTNAPTLVDSDYNNMATPAILASQPECIDPKRIFWTYPEDF